MDDETLDAEMSHWLGRDLRRANKAVFRNFAKEFGQYAIRPALYAAMSLIERFPGASGARLSELLSVPRANMVLIVRELEKRGLIIRTAPPDDKRSHAFYLSDAGKALLGELKEAHVRHEHYISSMMTDAERNFLVAILRRIWTSVEEPFEQPQADAAIAATAPR